MISENLKPMKFGEKVSIKLREYEKTQKRDKTSINFKVKREDLVKI